jgi:hypothetical protein
MPDTLTHHAPCPAGRVLRAAALAGCVLLSGCYVKLHGVQSTGGGAAATATSGQVGGSAKFSSGKASFSSGRAVSPHAAGGHVSLGKGASAVLVLGLVIAEAVNYIGSKFADARETAPRTESILETCSCYKKPVMSDE